MGKWGSGVRRIRGLLPPLPHLPTASSLNTHMPDDDSTLLKGRELIVAVCGGIAAYKVCDVVSKLAQRGAGVTVCMTDEAQRFVTPLTFEALSARKVHTS